MRCREFALGFVLSLLAGAGGAAAEVKLPGHTFTLPEGFTIELIAGPPLVDRPITADWDEQGRLYVSDSSGSNDKVDKQLADRPHQILRLVDTDGDGKFDQRTVFADKMMGLQDVYGPEIVERRGFECMVEMTKKMMNLQMTISEVPMILDTHARVGKSRMKIMKTIRGYFSLWFYKTKWLQMAGR